MALTKVGRLIDKGVIKDQTNLGTGAADTDEYLLYDASADALKSIAASNVTPNETLITGKTAETSPAADDLVLVYDTSAGALRKMTRADFVGAPDVTSVSPTNLTSGDGTGNYSIVITGTAFTGSTANLLKADGTVVNFDSQSVDSATQITGTIAKSSLSNADEPFGVKVTGSSNISDELLSQINIDAQPVFSTASGSLGTISDSGRSGISLSAVAADPESGGDITYTLESGSLPAGLSLTSTSSGAVISGNATAVSSNTTSNFTIRAADVNSNTTDRAFSITVNAPVQQSFTSSGTFSVPSGVSAVNVLVVAGGGGGGYDVGGGGGAGGLIYRPGFPVTPGGTVTVTVGNGGAGGDSQTGTPYRSAIVGQDSVFGTLTAKGGGGGGSGAGDGQHNPGTDGGSAGAGGWRDSPTGTATQPTQSGDSGNYGFGNVAGQPAGPGRRAAGGGGAAGAAGSNASTSGNGQGGNGGVGKAYTIADGTTSVYYAGGGGGGGQCSGQAGGTGGQGGGGNGAGCGVQNYESGTANRGGGGGGMRGAPFPSNAGAGGKGIVIVSY